MDKKIIALIIAVIVIILGAYLFAYVPYMNEENNKNYNAGLQNASALDKEMKESFKVNNASLNAADGIELTIQSLKDTESKLDEKIELLNNTRKYANGNITKEKYIDYQIELTQVEKSRVSDSIKEYEDFSDAFKKNDITRMMDVSNQMVKTVNTKNDEAVPIKDNIIKLLADNPDFNQTLHDLNLSDYYYGNMNLTHM